MPSAGSDKQTVHLSPSALSSFLITGQRCRLVSSGSGATGDGRMPPDLVILQLICVPFPVPQLQSVVQFRPPLSNQRFSLWAVISGNLHAFWNEHEWPDDRGTAYLNCLFKSATRFMLPFRLPLCSQPFSLCAILSGNLHSCWNEQDWPDDRGTHVLSIQIHNSCLCQRVVCHYAKGGCRCARAFPETCLCFHGGTTGHRTAHIYSHAV